MKKNIIITSVLVGLMLPSALAFADAPLPVVSIPQTPVDPSVCDGAPAQCAANAINRLNKVDVLLSTYLSATTTPSSANAALTSYLSSNNYYNSSNIATAFTGTSSPLLSAGANINSALETQLDLAAGGKDVIADYLNQQNPFTSGSQAQVNVSNAVSTYFSANPTKAAFVGAYLDQPTLSSDSKFQVNLAAALKAYYSNADNFGSNNFIQTYLDSSSKNNIFLSDSTTQNNIATGLATYFTKNAATSSNDFIKAYLNNKSNNPFSSGSGQTDILNAVNAGLTTKLASGASVLDTIDANVSTGLSKSGSNLNNSVNQAVQGYLANAKNNPFGGGNGGMNNMVTDNIAKGLNQYFSNLASNPQSGYTDFIGNYLDNNNPFGDTSTANTATKHIDIALGAELCGANKCASSTNDGSTPNLKDAINYLIQQKLNQIKTGGIDYMGPTIGGNPTTAADITNALENYNIVVLARGSYNLKDGTIVIPANKTLRGAGPGLTQLHFTAGTYTNNAVFNMQKAAEVADLSVSNATLMSSMSIFYYDAKSNSTTTDASSHYGDDPFKPLRGNSLGAVSSNQVLYFNNLNIDAGSANIINLSSNALQLNVNDVTATGKGSFISDSDKPVVKIENSNIETTHFYNNDTTNTAIGSYSEAINSVIPNDASFITLKGTPGQDGTTATRASGVVVKNTCFNQVALSALPRGVKGFSSGYSASGLLTFPNNSHNQSVGFKLGKPLLYSLFFDVGKHDPVNSINPLYVPGEDFDRECPSDNAEIANNKVLGSVFVSGK